MGFRVMSLERGYLPYQEARHSCRAMLSDRAHAKAELADKNVGPTGKKNDAPARWFRSIGFRVSRLVGSKAGYCQGASARVPREPSGRRSANKAMPYGEQDFDPSLAVLRRAMGRPP